MPVKSSMPIKLWGWVSRMRLLMVWLVFSFNRLVFLAQHDTSSGGAASAFPLKSLLQPCIVVGFGAYRLAAVELCAVAERGNRGKIALAYVHANKTRLSLWHGVAVFDG